jgi:hypothetical protein
MHKRWTYTPLAQAYFDPTVHAKVRDYAEAVHGSDFNLSTEPLDTLTIVRIGQGRKHGRLFIADNADSSSSAPSLSNVRAHSSLPIRARPTPTLSRVDELQVSLSNRGSLSYSSMFVAVQRYLDGCVLDSNPTSCKHFSVLENWEMCWEIIRSWRMVPIFQRLHFVLLIVSCA